MAANLKRNLIALAGASIGAATITGGAMSAWSSAHSSQPSSVLLPALAFIAANAVACFVIASTVGLAWHTLAKARGWTKAHAYWLPALLLGALIPIGLAGPGIIANRGTDTLSMSLLQLLVPYGAALGGLTGLFAWLIRRPDRDGPNPHTPAP